MLNTYAIGRHQLHHGDALDVLRAMPDASVDAVVTDPPYGLGKEPDALAMLRDWLTTGSHVVTGSGFMGCTWDAFVPQPVLWAEVLRVLKPGGHALVFAGTRTQDLMGLALRIAGFEVRDCLQWIYGSGFPKSLDVSKAIDARGGPEAIRRMQMGAEYTRSGRGRADYDNGSASKMNGVTGHVPSTPEAAQWNGWGTALKPAYEPVLLVRKPLIGTVAANVLAHGTGGLNIDACRIGTADLLVRPPISRDNNTVLGAGLVAGTQTEPSGRWPANVVLDEVAAELLDAQAGPLTSGANPTRRGSDKFRTLFGEFKGKTECTPARGADTGGASRFFYCAKASTAERGATNKHPTVKPLALMRWLCQLVAPPGGVILDPFAGSGTTLLAADALGFTCVAVEREAEHVGIITDRYTEATQQGTLLREVVG